MSNPPIIATGGEWPAGLALLRGVRSAGYAPIAALVRDDAVARWSRAPVAKARVPDPAEDPAAHAAGLARVAAEHGAAAVLPGTEASLRALAEHRDVFRGDTVVAVSGREAVARATDKSRLAELASGAGLRTPPTHEVRGAEDYAGPFPAIAKPSASMLADETGRHHHVGVTRVANRDELRGALEAMPRPEALVQPFMPGRLRTVNGVAWQGGVVCSVHKRSDRTWPPDAGIFAYGRTVAPDGPLDSACGRLLGDLGWSGLFNLQFLETDAGELYLIDLNPRAYHSLALAAGAGANLAGVWCDLLVGRPPRAAQARAGIRFRSEEDDLRTLRRMARAGDRRGALRGLVPRPRTVHALFELRDPGPVLQLGRTILRR